jgi:eukaryotic-like serine/threonine-protein kinase
VQASDGAEGARFRVIRELGAGGMGTVALVEDRVRGQRAALKRLHGASSRALRALKHEFRAVEALRHPHLVAPYELGQDEAGLYLLMELVEGVDLFSYCQGEHREASGPTHVETLLEARVLRTAESDDLAGAHAQGLRTHTLLTLKGEKLPGTAGFEPHTASPPLSPAGLARLTQVLGARLSARARARAP